MFEVLALACLLSVPECTEDTAFLAAIFSDQSFNTQLECKKWATQWMETLEIHDGTQVKIYCFEMVPK